MLVQGLDWKNIKMRYKYLTEVPVQISENDGQFIVKIPILKEIQ